MGSGRRHDSPMGVSSSPKSPRVGFAERLVSSVLREVNHVEHWTLYYFEDHAGKCRTCYEPLTVAKKGKSLCDEGLELATDVAKLLFRRKDGKVYSREKGRDREDVVVELPRDYVQCMGLLKAIQQSLKRGEQFIKPKSHDRSFYVPDRRPRTTERFARTPSPAPRYETRIVEPSPEVFEPRVTVRREEVEEFPKLNRGSLYGSDMDDLQRGQKMETEAGLRYKVVERTPSYLRSHRRYSTFG